MRTFAAWRCGKIADAVDASEPDMSKPVSSPSIADPVLVMGVLPVFVHVNESVAVSPGFIDVGVVALHVTVCPRAVIDTANAARNTNAWRMCDLSLQCGDARKYTIPAIQT